MNAWAASGAMELTGRAEGPPLGPPKGLLETIGVNGLSFLSERAFFAGLRRQGRRSCGGTCRLIQASDGWLAVTLARDEDRDLVPAWLDVAWTVDPWPIVENEVRDRAIGELVDRAQLLGLPVAALGERSASTPRPFHLLDIDGAPIVVDLSSLWAGPLAGSLLLGRGAEVVKVESIRRPDGARFGPPGFFDLMNAGKKSVALDLSGLSGQLHLRRLIAAADVVIEASRPRALLQMGIDAEEVLATGRPQVWVSITGYGRASNRAAFGDDAAVAGGLVAWEGDEPVFCADAIADPLSGLVAASAVTEALAEGRRGLIDIAMADVSASLAGPTLPVPPGLEPSRPKARPPAEEAAPLGTHTNEILTRLV